MRYRIRNIGKRACIMLFCILFLLTLFPVQVTVRAAEAQNEDSETVVAGHVDHTKAFSDSEKEWLSRNRTIRIAYEKNFLAFCGYDEINDDVCGALKTFVDLVNEQFDEDFLKVEAVPYATVEASMEALKNGEVDAVFPIYQSLDEAERIHVLLTEEIVKSPMTAIISSKDFDEFANNRVAIAEGFIDIEWYVREQYPNWTIVPYESFEECVEAVSKKEADCTVESTYVFRNLVDDSKIDYVALSNAAGVSFAVSRNEKELLSVMNRLIALIPNTSVVATMTQYSNPEPELTLMDFVQENIFAFAFIVGVVVLALAILLLKANASEAKAKVAEREMAEINELLRKSQEELEVALVGSNAANHAKTAFLNNMSHDIRTPMNAIIGFTSLAMSHIDDKEAVRDYLSKISVSGDHLLSLINDVLDMSRIESGQVRIEEKRVHLPDILMDLRTIIQSNIMKKQQNLYINMREVIHEDVFADKLRLNQVLLNIVSNAMKFTAEGGTIWIFVAEKSCMLDGFSTYEFRIRDNGIGMSKEFVGHIFEAFTRERTATVSGIQGTGLGMAITKNLVELMGGTITVESAEGEGSEFTVQVDLRLAGEEDEKEPAPQGQSAKTKVDAPLLYKKILLVEDNKLNQEIATALLEDIGCEVEVVDDGIAALERMAGPKGKQYDLIFMDIQMPKMDGYMATREIRALEDEHKAKIPIIAMTANAFEEDRKRAFEAGMNGFLAKPVSVDTLMKTLTGSQETEN